MVMPVFRWREDLMKVWDPMPGNELFGKKNHPLFRRWIHNLCTGERSIGWESRGARGLGKKGRQWRHESNCVGRLILKFWSIIMVADANKAVSRFLCLIPSLSLFIKPVRRINYEIPVFETFGNRRSLIVETKHSKPSFKHFQMRTKSFFDRAL